MLRACALAAGMLLLLCALVGVADAVPRPIGHMDDARRQLEDTPSPCQYCYVCGLDTSARPTLESLCTESASFRVMFATMEKIVPAVLIVAALFLIKGYRSTDRQPVDYNSGEHYTSKHEYGPDEEHGSQRWASVSTAVTRASTGEVEDVDIAYCHDYMLGKRDTIRNMHEGLEQVTNGKMENVGAEASSTMVLQVFMPMIGAVLNCTGVYSRMANIPLRDDTDPTNWFVILLTVTEFLFMHAFVALWLLRLGTPSAMPGDRNKDASGCCKPRWPTRATLKFRLVQHYHMLIGALSFNGFWFVARSKPLAIAVISKLTNRAEALLDQLRGTGGGNDGKQQQKRSAFGRIMALVDKDGDGDINGIEHFFAGLLGLVVVCAVSCLLVTVIVLILGFLAFFIALPIIAMYVKLSQVSFVAKGYPVCDWAPPSAQIANTCGVEGLDEGSCLAQNQLGAGTVCTWAEDSINGTATTAGTCTATVDACWDQNQALSFITFFVNIFGLSTLLESSRKGLDFMFRGSDGVVDAHEEKAIAVAEKLIIQAAMRRHGFLKALGLWNGFSQEKVFQIFIKKDQPEESEDCQGKGQDLEDGPSVPPAAALPASAGQP